MVGRRQNTMTLAEASALFSYEPATGMLRWKVARGKIKPGDLVSCKSNGYFSVMVDGRNFKAHRIIWLLAKGEWPTDEIDHRDGNPANNKPRNLRLATSSQNKMNCKIGRRNTTGCKGVYLDKRDGRWYARVSKNRTPLHLGRFDTKEQARAAYAAAATQHYGEFVCLTR
jgi:hypothetical protein